jgi:hypothetical protein
MVRDDCQASPVPALFPTHCLKTKANSVENKTVVRFAGESRVSRPRREFQKPTQLVVQQPSKELDSLPSLL